MAGRPALHGSEPGQVRKEAATAILCKCRGFGSPPPFFSASENNMNKGVGLLAGAFLALLTTAPAAAIDGVSAEIGSGDGVDMGRIGIQWDWNRRFFQQRDWHLGGYWDLALGQWHRGSVGPNQHEDITEIGLTPVLRVQGNGLVGPYLEAGIGFHLMSHSSIGDRNMSTAFQFGDHIGLGYRFGKTGLDISYRFQHLSNASIKRPNPGIGFNQIRLQYHF
jgi:lipid A 3-O-deacylase